jgi:meiosis-specific protein
MSLGEDIQRMSLNSEEGEGPDPVTQAAKQGKVPTLGEVKRSVKVCMRAFVVFIVLILATWQALVKRLIHATTQMDPLPSVSFYILYSYLHD